MDSHCLPIDTDQNKKKRGKNYIGNCGKVNDTNLGCCTTMIYLFKLGTVWSTCVVQ